MYKFVILVAVCVAAAHAGLISQPLALPLSPIVKVQPQLIQTPLIKAPLIIPQKVSPLIIEKQAPLIIQQQPLLKASPWIESPKSGLGLGLGGPLVGGWW